jgi:outer membrane lipoprotein LolB
MRSGFHYSLILFMLLGGCTTVRQPPPPGENLGTLNWETHLSQVSALQHWELKGKLGIRMPDDSSSVWLNWQQQPDQFRLHLTTLLGQTAALIEGDDRSVVLNTLEHENITAPSPELLLERELGWQFPVSRLQFWVKGIPAPSSRTSLTFNPRGLLGSLDQAGWTVNYDRYRQYHFTQPDDTPSHPTQSDRTQSDKTHAHTAWLPGRVRMTHKDLKLTVIVHDWQIH